MKQMNLLFVKQFPPDTELICEDGSKLFAHRLPLTIASRYFRAAYFVFGAPRKPENVRKSLNVPMLKCAQLEAALEYSYKGDADLTLTNIQDVVEAADFLRMDKLMNDCRAFMLENSHDTNVIALWRLAQIYMMNDVTRQLYHRIMEDFMQLANSDELLETTFEEFLGFVSDDHLNVRDEDKLCHVCVRWVEHDLENRRDHLFTLLKAVRVYLVDEAKLREMVAVSPLLRQDAQCYDYLMAVRKAMNTRVPLTVELTAELRKTTVPREPHGVILLHGGWLTAPCNMFEVYDPSADRHTLFPNLSDADEMRAYHKMAFVENDIYVIGGYNGNNHYHKNCRKFSLLEKKWSHVTPMNVERSYVSVAVIGRKIYAVGGYNGQYRLNTAEALDLDTNQWSFIRPMEFQRSDAACAVLDGKLYAIGGFTGTTCNRTVERYDSGRDTWTSVAQMNFVRSGVSAVTLNGKIYALGGSSGSARLSCCEVYDPKRDTWTPIASMLTARSNFAAVVCDDLIYVFGGYTGEATTRLCECYSPASDEWFVLTDMNHARSALAALFVPCFDGVHELAYPLRKEIFQEAQRPAPGPDTATARPPTGSASTDVPASNSTTTAATASATAATAGSTNFPVTTSQSSRTL